MRSTTTRTGQTVRAALLDGTYEKGQRIASSGIASCGVSNRRKETRAFAIAVIFCSYARALIEVGTPLSDVADLLGHSSLDTMRI